MCTKLGVREVLFPATNLIDDNCYHRVIYRLAYDENKVKSKRWISEGMGYMIEEGNIILLAVMIKLNCPPVEFTE